MKKFLSSINRALEYVKVDIFVFEEADYAFVSQKEVNEVREIFKAFDIQVRDLKVKMWSLIIIRYTLNY